MSGTLLLFPAWGARAGGWLRLDDGRVTARGPGEPPAPAEGVAERVVLVAPGEAVTLHWVELPDLAPEQARAAARLMAAEVAAEPIERLHVAVGVHGAAGRPVAVVAAAAMAGWLAEARARALDPDHVVPEPLLIPAPADADDRAERHWLRDDGLVVARGPASAHVAPAAVAALVAEGGAPLPIDDDAFEAGLGDALAALPLELRQGAFARRRRWGVDRALVTRLARLVAAIILVTLAVQVTLIARYRLEAARQRRAADAAAAAVLPRETRIVDAPAQLADRMARLRGGGLGFSETAGLLFQAVRATAGIELGAIGFAPDGTLTATVTAPGAPELDQLTQRLVAAGLSAVPGAQRMGGGRVVVDLAVRAP